MEMVYFFNKSLISVNRSSVVGLGKPTGSTNLIRFTNFLIKNIKCDNKEIDEC